MSNAKKTKGVLIKVKDLKKKERRAALEKALAVLLGKEGEKSANKPKNSM